MVGEYGRLGTEIAAVLLLVPSAERAVQLAEAKVAELEAQLANPGLYGDADGARKAGTLNKQLEAAKRDLERAMERWVE